jgi:hypothetical protein
MPKVTNDRSGSAISWTERTLRGTATAHTSEQALKAIEDLGENAVNTAHLGSLKDRIGLVSKKKANLLKSTNRTKAFIVEGDNYYPNYSLTQLRKKLVATPKKTKKVLADIAQIDTLITKKKIARTALSAFKEEKDKAHEASETLKGISQKTRELILKYGEINPDFTLITNVKWEPGAHTG